MEVSGARVFPAAASPAAAGTGAILAGLAVSRVRARLTGGSVLAASAAGYGLSACLFTGTTSVPVAYAGAFLWGVAGSVFGAVSLTTLQQVAPVHAHGRVMSVTATLQSWVESLALPLGGVTLAALGVRAGALALAGVAVTAGTVRPGKDLGSWLTARYSPSQAASLSERGREERRWRPALPKLTSSRCDQVSFKGWERTRHRSRYWLLLQVSVVIASARVLSDSTA